MMNSEAVSENTNPIVLIRGEPMVEMPQDLYIPPDALQVILDTFEGPLDLLLYLIRKANIDVLDIPMAELTQQYLHYVEHIRSHNLELAAEYLLMAALLIEIKSRMLLPRPQHVEDKVEEDPRAALVKRLLEYERMKLAAQKLDTLPRSDRDFNWIEVLLEQSVTKRLPQINSNDLLAAWRELVMQARIKRHHKVTREQLSVREHMSKILRRLKDLNFIEFQQLFDVSEGVPVLVVNFLAILELAKESLIEITQAQTSAPIYVRLTHAHPQ